VVILYKLYIRQSFYCLR